MGSDSLGRRKRIVPAWWADAKLGIFIHWVPASVPGYAPTAMGIRELLGSDTPNDPGPWEGELRNMWKPTQQEGLWFQGGNLMQARHYSLYLALQLKARLEGLATPVYGLRPVRHLA